MSKSGIQKLHLSIPHQQTKAHGVEVPKALDSERHAKEIRQSSSPVEESNCRHKTRQMLGAKLETKNGKAREAQL